MVSGGMMRPQVSKAAASGIPLSPASAAAVAAAGATVHLIFLAVNSISVRLLGLGRRRGNGAALRPSSRAAVAEAEAQRGVQRAVILVSSQKTLPVRGPLRAGEGPYDTILSGASRQWQMTT